MAKTKQTYIYHITNVDNLSSIIEEGCLRSDRRLVNTPAKKPVVIGLDHIKKRRLEERPVHCHAGTKVGDYVPFYFCPRSPMLYVIHMKNTELTYRSGQERIVHLVSTTDTAIQTAGNRPWAFSDGNAGARYTGFSSDISKLPTFVNWQAVKAEQWSGQGIDPVVKNKKQAEFLVHEQFSWTSIGVIGVIQQSVADEVQQVLENADHIPQVKIRPKWYY